MGKKSYISKNERAMCSLLGNHIDPLAQFYEHGMRNKTLLSKRDCKNRVYGDLFEQFHKEGFVLFSPCYDDRSVLDAVEGYTRNITTNRVQNACIHNPAVARLALDRIILEFLDFLHGRHAFPFQTLNFLYGTQQAIHSDVVHFDTLPQRALMAAAWIALEDIHQDSGPLVYYPGSHKWGLWDFEELHLHALDNIRPKSEDYGRYEQALKDAIHTTGLRPALADRVKRGDVIIWAASLLHGGSKRNKPNLTRASQVTHYFFEGTRNCMTQYWVPRASYLATGQVTHKCDILPCVNRGHPSLRGKSCAEWYRQRFSNGNFFAKKEQFDRMGHSCFLN